MYKFLIAIGLGFLLLGCSTTKVSIPTTYLSKWVQPTNKSEKCEILIEDYIDSPHEESISTIQWDGDCKDGKATGLGKIVTDTGAINRYEIGFVRKGISEQYFVQGDFGVANTVVGRYFRENGKLTKAHVCKATQKEDYNFIADKCGVADFKSGVFQLDNSTRGVVEKATSMVKKYNAMSNSHISKVKPKVSGTVLTGTGFFVSNDGYVITNSHVIEGASTISLMLDGKKIPARIVDHDSSNDIALLKVDKTVEGLSIELKKKTKQGTEVAVLGYPNIGLQGNEQKSTFGFINANSGIQGDTRYFQISAPIQPGNSGSPMVNEKGVVIGIVSATLNQSAALNTTGTLAQNVNYAVKIAYALPMLINHGVDYVEPASQRTLEKTMLIESISDSVVLVVAEQ